MEWLSPGINPRLNLAWQIFSRDIINCSTTISIQLARSVQQFDVKGDTLSRIFFVLQCNTSMKYFIQTIITLVTPSQAQAIHGNYLHLVASKAQTGHPVLERDYHSIASDRDFPDHHSSILATRKRWRHSVRARPYSGHRHYLFPLMRNLW